MTAPDTLNGRLSAWTHGLDFDRLPARVAHETRLRILDITGAMLGGRDTALAGQVRAAVFAQGGADTPVVGFGGRTGAAHAALLQGTMACVLEYDDTHVATGLHPGSPVVAAALAAGQRAGVSGRALIAAVAVGNETACRLGLVAPGTFHKVGLHPTGVLGVFGAGYAAARLAGLEPRRTAAALGLCGSFSSGIMASWEDGSAAKSLHAGWAAASAIQAVQLAGCGVSGPGAVYEGRFGFFRAHVQAPGQDFDWEAAGAQLGERWELLNIAPRAYPCGHYIQPFIDAALRIAGERRITARDVAQIECLAADYMIPLICEPAQEKIRPATSWHARYSLPFCVAQCLLDGRFDKYSLAEAQLGDGSYTGLAAKVVCREDPRASDRGKWSGEVIVSLRTGERLRHRIEHMRGTPANPMSEQELIDKFLHNTSGVLHPDQAGRIVERILDLQEAQDVRTVFEPLCADAP